MNYDIYHIINENQDKENDLSLNVFLLITSILNIDSNYKIYYHYYNLPDNSISNKLWNKLINYNNIIYIKINIPYRIFSKYKYTYINKILYDNGGIYLNNYVLLLNKINNNYNYFKTKNNEIIGSIKNSITAHLLYIYNSSIASDNIIKKYKDFNFSDNIKILDYNYNYNNINEIYEKEIFDYSFGKYFHLVNNCDFFIGDRDLYNINKEMISKITIYNLLIKYVLGYKYMYNSKELFSGVNNYNLINRIDIIYWINLDRTEYRRANMERVLLNFSIPNERISAIDSKLDDNIKSKYFILTDNIQYKYSSIFSELLDNDNYPNYSNTEYAILASHLYTINKFIELKQSGDEELFSEVLKKENICLICEDDLSLDFIQYWNKSTSEIIKNAPHDWDIIMLGYFSLKLDYEEYTKWNNEWSALAYLVNKNNIKDKINELKVYDENNNFKWKCSKDDLMVSDNYIFSKFNTYVYKYPYFTFPNNNDSTLHSDHLSYHKIYKNCNYLVWNNVINELFI